MWVSYSEVSWAGQRVVSYQSGNYSKEMNLRIDIIISYNYISIVVIESLSTREISYWHSITVRSTFITSRGDYYTSQELRRTHGLP